ncbi:hypothetical protein [Clostridium sp. 1001271B_151109_B4]|uniref:hypothetical protein n=1 Tax=Clostridium sp. 1001271B_151109_B4 TaxID=2787148 RepID=UPI0018AAC1F9|nr:hypothetical protein [Clostridium sp. 1001271B_151109_B4]
MNGRTNTDLDSEFYIYITDVINIKGRYNYVNHEAFNTFKNNMLDINNDMIKNINVLNNSVDIVDKGVTVNFSDFVNEDLRDSEIINNILSFTSAFEKRTIVIDEDIFIDKAILLPSNTTVIINNCTIKQNDEVFDNVFRGDNMKLSTWDLYYVPSEIEYNNNIKILGKGNARIEGCTVNKKTHR